jgi:hypothetical protein
VPAPRIYALQAFLRLIFIAILLRARCEGRRSLFFSAVLAARERERERGVDMIFPCRALFRNGSRVRALVGAGGAAHSAYRSRRRRSSAVGCCGVGRRCMPPSASLSLALSSAGAITITMHCLIAPTANLFRWCVDTSLIKMQISLVHACRNLAILSNKLYMVKNRTNKPIYLSSRQSPL